MMVMMLRARLRDNHALYHDEDRRSRSRLRMIMVIVTMLMATVTKKVVLLTMMQPVTKQKHSGKILTKPAARQRVRHFESLVNFVAFNRKEPQRVFLPAGRAARVFLHEGSELSRDIGI